MLKVKGLKGSTKEHKYLTVLSKLTNFGPYLTELHFAKSSDNNWENEIQLFNKTRRILFHFWIITNSKGSPSFIIPFANPPRLLKAFSIRQFHFL